MRLLVISSAPLIRVSGAWNAYAPYVREMDIWARYGDEICFCCPEWETTRGLLVEPLPFALSRHIRLVDFNIRSPLSVLKALWAVMWNTVLIFRAMIWADHIHLRCPGNASLLAAVVQIAFPRKRKTAKYAGNWDAAAPQPLSYRIQKRILANGFWSRRTTVLAYGEWPDAPSNVKAFFTATYSGSEVPRSIEKPVLLPIRLVFAGMLTAAKRPAYALELVRSLAESGMAVRLEIFGSGPMKEELAAQISEWELAHKVTIWGNQPKEVLKEAYKEAHFVVLPSVSEGWPKAIAEGMFWGCIPLATPVSCVPAMLDNGTRGVLLSLDLQRDTKALVDLLNDTGRMKRTAAAAAAWSQKYTLERFEAEIRKLLVE